MFSNVSCFGEADFIPKSVGDGKGNYGNLDPGWYIEVPKTVDLEGEASELAALLAWTGGDFSGGEDASDHRGV